MSKSNEYRRVAASMAERYGVDPELFVSLVERESGFDPKAKGADGEIGLTQIMSETGIKPGFGVTPIQDRNDPVDNLRFGAEYLGALIRNYEGDVSKALMAYNGGSGNVDQGTVSVGAKKYATELMNGKELKVPVANGAMGKSAVSAGMKQLSDGIAALNVKPKISAPAPRTPGGFGSSGRMSPLSRAGIPGLGMINRYSTPGGLESLSRGRR